MQLDFNFADCPPVEAGVLKVEFTDLLEFGNRTDLFFVPRKGDSVSGVSFLEPAEGVILVNGSGHLTEF